MIAQRQYPRYDHVYISLKLKDQTEWHWVKVYNWSASGFNFLFDSPIEVGETFAFKKALDAFEGSIIWEKKKLTNEDLLFMSMNRILAKKFEEKFKTFKFDFDFIELLRTDDVAAKLEYAQKYLGFFISRDMMIKEIEANHWENKLQYGVHIADPKWVGIFDEAMAQSAPLVGMDKSIDEKVGKLVASN